MSPDPLPRADALVLYHGRPARVCRVGEKLEIELEGGETQRVRPKDVTLLHPGPIKTLAELQPQAGEVETAWEILAGSVVSVRELAELAFGAFTPATAWATWQLALDGLYFRPAGGPQGDPADGVRAATSGELNERLATQAAEAAQKQAWEEFVNRVRAGACGPEDERFLGEVEALAWGRADRSRVLRELSRAEPHISGEETPENAHALLLKLGYWTPAVNPYPRRANLPLAAPDLPVPPLPAEPRRDLTHLLALAIDDPRADVPDDALSLEEGRLWVHVADPAAVITPDSPLDLEARGRAATLYIPEGPVSMLPSAATPIFGLGLAEVSPALSFGITLDVEGQVAGLEVTPSWVRVTRLTYEEATERLDEEPLRTLYRLGQAHEDRRRARGAVIFDLPEVHIWLAGDRVHIESVPALPSRALVENGMVLAGEAIAQYAIAHGIPLPYATQDPPDFNERPAADAPLSTMFALRRGMKRSQYRSTPAPHAGLGLDAYVQATSPMRRYLDLVAHQQLRAYLQGRPLLTAEEILARVGAVEAIVGTLRQAERQSEQHWTLVYLLQNEEWRGTGVLVEKRDLHGKVIIPDLGWETTVHLPADLPLDATLKLACKAVDLPRLDARFRVLGVSASA